MTTFIHDVSFLVPTADLAATRTALAAATGRSSDASVSLPQVTVSGTNYYSGCLALSDSGKTSFKSFLDASASRKYVIKTHGSDLVTSASTAESAYVGQFANIKQLGQTLDNAATVATTLNTAWTYWKTNFIDGSGRVLNPDVYRGGSFVPGWLTEGQSYAMHKAVVNNDQTTFDLVWNWTKANLQVQVSNPNSKPFGKLFWWAKYQSDGVISYGTVPDGDVLIAYTLLLAHERGWTPASGPSYLAQAQEIMPQMWTYYVHGRGKVIPSAGLSHPTASSAMPTYVMASTDPDSTYLWLDANGVLVHSNYLMTPCFRKFSEYDTANAAGWAQLADDSYDLIEGSVGLEAFGVPEGKSLPPETFLVDWTTGKPKQTNQTGSKDDHKYGTSRWFWLAGQDALNGSTRAIEHLRWWQDHDGYEAYYRVNGNLPTQWYESGNVLGSSGDVHVAALAGYTGLFNPAKARALYDRIQAAAWNVAGYWEYTGEYFIESIFYYHLCQLARPAVY